ncbi:MAG: (d)CMP kinase [Actinomycetia bacterium]|nr:(d)CMP kinase [Actinomycetes bacterium]
MMGVVVAIDGGSGVGKTTLSRALAQRLGLDHLDTGAMYRAVTFAVLRDGVDPADDPAVTELTSRLVLHIGAQVFVDGDDATEAIRGPEVTNAVSAVAAHPGVRTDLVARQRAWVAEHRGGVVEGRDIGTVVCPDADLKIYLVADDEVRAARRAVDEARTDQSEVASDLARRDRADSTRRHDPLRMADDALEVDTSHHSVDELVQLLLERLPAGDRRG